MYNPITSCLMCQNINFLNLHYFYCIVNLEHAKIDIEDSYYLVINNILALLCNLDIGTCNGIIARDLYN